MISTHIPTLRVPTLVSREERYAHIINHPEFTAYFIFRSPWKLISSASTRWRGSWSSIGTSSTIAHVRYMEQEHPTAQTRQFTLNRACFSFSPSPVYPFFLCNRNPLQATLDSTGAYVTPSNEPPNDPVFVYYPNETASARGSISAWRTSISMIDRHSSKLRTGGYSVSTSLQSYPYDV